MNASSRVSLAVTFHILDGYTWSVITQKGKSENGGNFRAPCFLVTSVLRFAYLPYNRRYEPKHSRIYDYVKYL